jgi:hypothetical protein
MVSDLIVLIASSEVETSSRVAHLLGKCCAEALTLREFRIGLARASLCSLSRLSSGSRAVAPISRKTINSDQLSKAEGVNTCNSLMFRVKSMS